MIAILTSAPLNRLLLDAGLLAASIGMLNAIIRLILCALAGYAVHEALKKADVGADDNSARDYRLGVLREILSALAARSNRGRNPAARP
jgi:hypothetical protein